MTQEEFNLMLQTAIAQGLPGGYYTSKYSGEEIDEKLDDLDSKAPLESPAFTGTPTVNGVEIGTGGGSLVSGVNLLDNAWWDNSDNIIDQRGGYVVPPGTVYYGDTGLATTAGTVSVYTTAVYVNGTYGAITMDGTTYYVAWSDAVRGYANLLYQHSIDRWRGNAIHVLVEDDGPTLVANADNSHDVKIFQTIENSRSNGGMVTFSVLVNNTLYTVTTVDDVYADCETDFGTMLVWPTFSSTTDRSIELRFNKMLTGEKIKIKSFKFELGDTQTLAHQDENGNWVLNDPPPNIQQELAKCQRYYFRKHFVQNETVGLCYTGPEWLTLSLGIGQQMRHSNPTGTLTGSLNVIGTATLSAPVTTIGQVTVSGSMANVGFAVVPTSQGPGYLYPLDASGATIELNCEL